MVGCSILLDFRLDTHGLIFEVVLVVFETAEVTANFN